MIHFFTIVLNGMPFIKYHIKVFKKLTIPWCWHIIEGVADLKHDTAWGAKNGGRIPDEFHYHGLSIDGTTEYLMFLMDQHKENIIVYRKPLRKFWDGKIEMVSAPLKNITEPCLLWQVDSDELWTKESIERVSHLFRDNPTKNSAYFYCYYFIGPKQYIVSNGVKSTRDWDWLRVWRFKPGMKWRSHEPPVMVNGTGVDVGKSNPFTCREMIHNRVTFQHFAYATYESVAFKEAYYGYKGVVDFWRKIQLNKGRRETGGFPHWIDKSTVVDDWDERRNGRILWKG